MLPKDIYSIIESYNEIGVFVKDDLNTYWFNGKRWELWYPIKKFKWFYKLYVTFKDITYNFATYHYYKNKEWHNFSHPISDRKICKFVVLVNDLIYMKVNQHIWIFNPDIGWKQWSFESPKFTGEIFPIDDYDT